MTSYALSRNLVSTSRPCSTTWANINRSIGRSMTLKLDNMRRSDAAVRFSRYINTHNRQSISAIYLIVSNSAVCVSSIEHFIGVGGWRKLATNLSPFANNTTGECARRQSASATSPPQRPQPYAHTRQRCRSLYHAAQPQAPAFTFGQRLLAHQLRATQRSLPVQRLLRHLLRPACCASLPQSAHPGVPPRSVGYSGQVSARSRCTVARCASASRPASR